MKQRRRAYAFNGAALMWTAIIFFVLGCILGNVSGYHFNTWFNSNYVSINSISNTENLLEESNSDFVFRMRSFQRTVIQNLQIVNLGTSKSVGDFKRLASILAINAGIDDKLIEAIIWRESAWRQKVISEAGAVGFMQIMPRTGWGECGLSESQLFDGELNIKCGIAYFSALLTMFQDVEVALCAYNYGPTRVRRMGKKDGKKGRCPRGVRQTTLYKKAIMKRWGGNSKEWGI